MRRLNGKTSFYQWDINQKITSSEFNIGDEIHFHNIRQSEALVMLAYESDGEVVADVPNILLQTSYPIRVYKYLTQGTSGQTVYEHTFEVIQRPKPSDYVYTETEVLTITSVVNKAIEDAVASGDFKGDKGEKGDTGERGEKGEPGRNGTDGKDGEDGYTPQKGVDYYTDDEKSEMIADISRETSTRCANAIKSTASGEVIRVDDVSPNKHIVTVKVYGKNLLNHNELSANSTVKNEDGSMTITPLTGSAVVSSTSLGTFVHNLKAGNVYTLSGETTSTVHKYIYLLGSSQRWDFGTSRTITEKDINKGIYLYSNGQGESATFSNLQIEEGDTATEYEPYLDPTTVTITRYGVDENDNSETYTPNADGIVEITSLSPTMTLLTDTDGVNIDLEYNQDTNKAIGNVKEDIRTLDNDMAELKNGGSSITVDAELSSTSENPVQNKVLALILDEHNTQFSLLNDIVNSNIKSINANLVSIQNMSTDIFSLENQMGDIETALDNIIAIQNELIGGDSI